MCFCVVGDGDGAVGEDGVMRTQPPYRKAISNSSLKEIINQSD